MGSVPLTNELTLQVPYKGWSADEQNVARRWVAGDVLHVLSCCHGDVSSLLAPCQVRLSARLPPTLRSSAPYQGSPAARYQDAALLEKTFVCRWHAAVFTGHCLVLFVVFPHGHHNGGLSLLPTKSVITELFSKQYTRLHWSVWRYSCVLWDQNG